MPEDLAPEPVQYVASDCVVFRRTRKPFGGLSNMASGFPLAVDGTKILTAEALYQSSRFPDRPDVQERILAQRSPIDAKRIARVEASLSRADWMHVRVPIMRWCLRVKLACAWSKFGELLLSTGGRAIVELSPSDPFWGAAPVDGGPVLEGCNVLGRLLAELRDVRRSDPTSPEHVNPPPVPGFRVLGREVGAIAADRGPSVR